MRKWRIEDSEELYNIKGWGVNYFGINDKGNVYVAPRKDGVQIDLKEVVDELATRHIQAPVLLRFPDILDNRIEKTNECFVKAGKEYNFQGDHFIIFPIKVNQMRPVVEEIISRTRAKCANGARKLDPIGIICKVMKRSVAAADQNAVIRGQLRAECGKVKSDEVDLFHTQLC